MKFFIFLVLILKNCSSQDKIELNKTEAMILPENSKVVKPKQGLICPGSDIARPFFVLPCQTTKDCVAKTQICCNKRCLKGINPPILEPVHSLHRICPINPIPEFRDIKQCTTDDDCKPRICCPEKNGNGDIVGYCRTPQAKLPNGSERFMEPLKILMSYMQCTAAPPPILDVFPKTCKNGLDCFPNLCCQEKGKKYCRPPRRSILSLIASASQRLVPNEGIRKLITRII